MRTASSHTPIATAHCAAVARSTIHARFGRAVGTRCEHVAIGDAARRASVEPRLGIEVRRVLTLARDAAGRRVDEREHDSRRRRCDAGTSTRSATSPGRDAVLLTPSSTQPSPSRVAVVCGASGSAPNSTSAAVSTVSPRPTPGATRPAARRMPNCAIGRPPSTTVAQVRHRRDRAPDLLEHERGLEEAVARDRPAPRAPRRRASRPRRAGPEVAVEPVTAGVDLARRSFVSSPSRICLARFCRSCCSS